MNQMYFEKNEMKYLYNALKDLENKINISEYNFNKKIHDSQKKLHYRHIENQRKYEGVLAKRYSNHEELASRTIEKVNLTKKKIVIYN